MTMMKFFCASYLAIFCLLTFPLAAQEDDIPITYAERLGWQKGDRLLILHIDDAGMSFDSNMGTIKALEEGVANSVSVMMPCPWVPGFVKYLQENPQVDAGLHLTLTSEWEDYRWGPLVGKPQAPGLVDQEGALWPDVRGVVENASPDEVEAEIRAQLDRARSMGFEPTHLDSHMGALFGSNEFIERYVKVGISEQIPVMFPAGHNTLLIEQLGAEGKSLTALHLAREVGKVLWEGGLPVLDDLHNRSYGWNLPPDVEATDENIRQLKVAKYVEAIKSLRPGVTMMIMHCTDPTEVFPHISNSGDTRKGDLLAMLDPAVKRTLEEEGIILTTWRELKARRDQVEEGKN